MNPRRTPGGVHRPTPLSWVTLGSRQQRLLLEARADPVGRVKVFLRGEQQSALRLHEKGLFDRGRTAKDYSINTKGLEIIPNG